MQIKNNYGGKLEDLCLVIITGGDQYEFHPDKIDDTTYTFGSTSIFFPVTAQPYEDGSAESYHFTAYVRFWYMDRSQASGSIDMTFDAFGYETVTYGDNTENLLKDQLDQDKSFHDQDREDASKAGSDMTNFAGQLENVKNKWAILWYPIEFTNSIFGAFQGTQSAAYSARYGAIERYTYDDEQGLLVPVYSTARAAPSGGTTITFPSYTLPVLGVKLWDEYTFDISTVKDNLPVVFDFIYVAIGILETYWFVGFLIDKFHEVFG